MPCSLCKESGHNIRTCQRKYSTETSTEQKLSKEDVRESVAISKVKYPDKSGIVGQLPIITPTKNKSKTNDIRLDENSNHISNIEKPNKSDNSKKPSEKVEDDEKVVSIKNKSFIKSTVVSPTSRKCAKKKSRCIIVNNEIGDSDSLKSKVINNWKHIQIEDGDKDILCNKGVERFREGLTEDEGKGHIYMYTHSKDSSVTDDQRFTFKIGMTKDLPERRIRVLENGNNEKYIMVHSVEVAWRRLAENLIHKQLTAMGYHSPRKNIKGGTEWFTGEKDKIIEVINLVIRFLKVYALPMA